MAVLDTDIKALMKAVMSSTMKTVAAAQKTVISPTEVRNITKEILADFETGSIDKFIRALDRSEKIIDKLSINIKDFNTGLAKRIEQLKELRDKSAKQVEELRKNHAVEYLPLEKEYADITVRDYFSKYGFIFIGTKQITGGKYGKIVQFFPKNGIKADMISLDGYSRNAAKPFIKVRGLIWDLKSFIPYTKIWNSKI